MACRPKGPLGRSGDACAAQAPPGLFKVIRGEAGHDAEHPQAPVVLGDFFARATHQALSCDCVPGLDDPDARAVLGVIAAEWLGLDLVFVATCHPDPRPGLIQAVPQGQGEQYLEGLARNPSMSGFLEKFRAAPASR